MSEVVPSNGAYAYGGYPDIDAMYKEQALVTDRRKREALLHQIHQILHERVRFAPIWEYIWPSGVGPRVEEPALMLINPYPWSAPLEEVRLKKRSEGATGSSQAGRRCPVPRLVDLDDRHAISAGATPDRVHQFELRVIAPGQ
jgi:hypothetical protein